jgi:hypothetical protein
MLILAKNKGQLKYLSPVLKAKVEHQLAALADSQADANAIVKFLDPEKYVQHSTLRSFIGRIVGYIPAVIRCLLSPLAALCAGSWLSAKRPWKDLGAMLLDDLTSTVQAILTVTHKVLEALFNRLLRTLADIVVNGIVARVASFFGYHAVTLAGYEVSAKADLFQETLCSNTTGRLMTTLVRANTTPNPEVGLQNGIEARMRVSFFDKVPALNQEPHSPSGEPTLTV